MASAQRGGKTTRPNLRSIQRELAQAQTVKGTEEESRDRGGQRTGAWAKGNAVKPSVGYGGGSERSLPRWKEPMTAKCGLFLPTTNRFETSEEEEVLIKSMRGEEEDEAMHAAIVAAIEAESGSILTNFGTEDLAKVVLITIKAAVPAIVKAVQKQLSASVDSYRLDKRGEQI